MPRRIPERRPRFGDSWKEHREPVDVNPLEELEATIGRYIEAVPKVRINPAPIFGCLGQLVKVAVILLILFVMATCWYFSGGGI